MKPSFPDQKRCFPLAIITGLLATQTTLAQPANQDEHAIEQIYVYGEPGETNTATKLNLTIFETPQTVTAISRVQMDDFSLNKINQVLDYTPGVTVEEVETNRSYYTARGFDIVNFQYDGIGAPFFAGLNLGQQDSAIYEKVEVVKGAAGLITGVANPSATVNYIRKRPTNEVQASAALSVNEWSGYRLDGDISGSLSGNIRGRLVVVSEDTKSYLDRYQSSTNLFYGIIEADLSSTTLLTVGHSYDDHSADGTLWGALPLTYADESPTNYDVSTSNAAEWTYANNAENQTFVELNQQLNDQWMLNAIYTHTNRENESELFYVSGAPNLDETGMSAFPSDTERETDMDVYDLYVSGHFDLFGREHQLVAGYNHVNIEAELTGYYDGDEVTSVGADWAEGNTPRPNNFETLWGTGNVETTQKSVYISTHLNATDQLSILLGARKVDLKQQGVSYGASQDMDANETTPYYGATFLITENLSAYGSYSEAFTPQNFVTDQLTPIGPAEGTNSEIGLKQSFNDKHAVLTVALFQASHSNLGEYKEEVDGVNVYDSKEYESDGFEVEISGELFNGLNVGAGFTQFNLEGTSGNKARPFVPKKLLKASASYRIPTLPDLKIGGILKWQDEINTPDGLAHQDEYILMDLAAHYSFSSNISASLMIENITDKKYYNSLYWDQAYYGAPRNVQASVRWAF